MEKSNKSRRSWPPFDKGLTTVQERVEHWVHQLIVSDRRQAAYRELAMWAAAMGELDEIPPVLTARAARVRK